MSVGHCLNPGEPARSALGPLRFVLLDMDNDSRPTTAAAPLASLLDKKSGSGITLFWQVIQLICDLAHSFDMLPRLSFYWLTTYAVYILNPDDVGVSQKRLDYRFCPYSLFLDNDAERPVGETRRTIMMRSMANFVAQLAKRLGYVELSIAHAQLLQACETSSIEKVSSVQIISQWQKTLNDTGLEKHSPTVENASLLLALLQCRDKKMQTPMYASLMALLNGSDGAKAAMCLAKNVACLVPKGKQLECPALYARNAIWIMRINLISQILYRLHMSGQGGMLEECQQVLVKNGIDRCLSHAAFASQNISRRLSVAWVRLVILTSIHFATFRVRYIFEENVLKIAAFALNATCCPEDIMNPSEAHRLIAMAMVMSDFWEWDTVLYPNLPEHQVHQETTNAMIKIWDSLDDDVFLQSVLPCWDEYISCAGCAALSKRLERICLDITVLIKESKNNNSPRLESNKAKLTYILRWMSTLAWMTPHQVAFASPITSCCHYNTSKSTNTKSEGDAILRALGLPLDKVKIESKTWEGLKYCNGLCQDFAEWHFDEARFEVCKAKDEGFDDPKYLLPTPQDGGAPDAPDSVYLEIPPDVECLKYNSSKASVYSTSSQNDGCSGAFLPVTCMTNQPVCKTSISGGGTCGMFKMTVLDGGQSNQLMLGLTWHGAKQGDSIQALRPGETRTSVGLDIATGHVHFMDNYGKHINRPYIRRMGSGSHVVVGIANQRVYFVVDGSFGPPVQGLYIPPNHPVYAVVQFGTADAAVKTQCMGSKWTTGALNSEVSRNNLIAFSLQLAHLRTKMCPHYHIRKRTRDSRPHIAASMQPEGDNHELLNEQQKMLVQKIVLASAACDVSSSTCVDAQKLFV